MRYIVQLCRYVVWDVGSARRCHCRLLGLGAVATSPNVNIGDVETHRQLRGELGCDGGRRRPGAWPWARRTRMLSAVLPNDRPHEAHVLVPVRRKRLLVPLVPYGRPTGQFTKLIWKSILEQHVLIAAEVCVAAKYVRVPGGKGKLSALRIIFVSPLLFYSLYGLHTSLFPTNLSTCPRPLSLSLSLSLVFTSSLGCFPRRRTRPVRTARQSNSRGWRVCGADRHRL